MQLLLTLRGSSKVLHIRPFNLSVLPDHPGGPTCYLRVFLHSTDPALSLSQFHWFHCVLLPLAFMSLSPLMFIYGTWPNIGNLGSVCWPNQCAPGLCYYQVVFQSFLTVVVFHISGSDICLHGSSTAPQCELSQLCHDQSSRLLSAELVPLCLLVNHMMARRPSRVVEGVKVDEVDTMMRCKTFKARGQGRKSKWK